MTYRLLCCLALLFGAWAPQLAAHGTNGIIVQPADQTVRAGDTVLFRMEVGSDSRANPQYTWKRNGTQVTSGVANNGSITTLQFTATAGDSGSTYTCTFYDSWDKTWKTSQTVSLTVLPAETVITAAILAPAAGALPWNTDLSFTVAGVSPTWTWSVTPAEAMPSTITRLRQLSVQGLQQIDARIPMPVTPPVPTQLTLTITASGSTATRTWTFAALPPLAPNAVSDTYETWAGSTMTKDAPGVLANDYDLNGPIPSQAVLAEDLNVGGPALPAGAALTLQSQGGFTLITPESATTRAFYFQYLAKDAGGLTSATKALVTVTARANRLPRLLPDVVVLTANMATVIPVLANDIELDGDAMTVTAVSAPGVGTATVEADQRQVRFTPPPTFTAATTCTYTVSDGKSPPQTAQITIYPAGGSTNGPGDVNGDGVVNAQDLQSVVQHFGTTYP